METRTSRSVDSEYVRSSILRAESLELLHPPARLCIRLYGAGVRPSDKLACFSANMVQIEIACRPIYEKYKK